MIKVKSLVRIYEQNDVQAPCVNYPELEVGSHAFRDEFVVLKFDGVRIVVSEADLRAAVSNATNSASH